MKFKKSMIIIPTVLTTLGLAAQQEVQASEVWEARTVAEIKADFVEDTEGDTYTVVKGDTLGAISKASGVDLNTLVAINNISNADLIHVGNHITFTKDTKGKVNEVVIDNAGVEESYNVEEESIDAVKETVNTFTPKEVTQPLESNYEAPKEAYVEPVVEAVVEAAPVEVAPVEVVEAVPVQPNNTLTVSDAEAKEWIAQRESGGDYNAYNPAGGYWGKYQLNPTLVAYGASPAEQEIAVQEYVNERYNGSFVQAKAHWQAKGWY